MKMTNQFKAWCCSGLLALGILVGREAGAQQCTYQLSRDSRNHGYGQTNNSVGVTTESNCTWNVASQVSWITIQPGWGGTGTGLVSYVVAANPITTGRTGTVLIAGQTFTVRQDPLPCDYSLSPGSRSPGRTGGNSSFDVTATAGCAWMASNGTPWITLTGNTNGVGSGTPTTITYHVDTNTTPIWRTGYVAVATETFVLSQNPAPCIWELSPTNTNRGYPGTNGTVNVNLTSGGNCSWIVQNTNNWIVITNLSGIGSGSFNYQVISNSSSISRTGTVTVWGKTFLITQAGAPCNPSIAPSSSSPEAETETRTVNVTSALGCQWYVTNNVSWITVQPMSGSGSASVSVIIAANPGNDGRTGVVSIAGENYTVRQDGLVCTYKLSATNRTHSSLAKTNSVGIDTVSVCSWNVQNTNLWLTFPVTSGVGDNTNIIYYTEANPQIEDRSGYVLIGGQQLFITQRGVGCVASISPTTRGHGHPATNNVFSVTIGASCLWTVTTTNDWLHIPVTNGVGSTANIAYSIDANLIGLPRTGYITVEGDATLTITQNAAPCTNSLSTNRFTHTAAAEIGSVIVLSTIGCSLTITNTNSWITILAGEGDTSGATNVIYQLDTNLTGVARSGVILIGERNYTVTQNPVICNYKLSTLQRSHGPGGTEDKLTMNVAYPCPWSAVTTNDWIMITTNAAGAGTNDIWYTVDPNPVPFQRVGAIQVEGQTCVITQRPANCTFSITPSTTEHGYGATSNWFTLNTLNGCSWSASTTNDWITIASGFGGTNSSDVGYTIQSNTNFTQRLGYIMADGQTFTITQRSAICSFSLSPTHRDHGYTAKTNTAFVDTAPGCGWNVENTNTWIAIQSGANGIGTGTVTYAISSNLNTTPRIGWFKVDDKTFSITQAAYLCTIKLSDNDRQHGFGQTNRSIGITAGPSCAWTVNNTNEWIVITSGLSGTGNGSFDYIIYPNDGNATRTAQIYVEDEILTITQLASTNGLRIESLIVNPAGDLTLKLNGGPPGIWEILTSSNLTTWQRIGYATNTSGKVDFLTPAATNRFYKAFLP
jgi:hypothetical protein